MRYKCLKCGNESNLENGRFCTKCGNLLTDNTGIQSKSKKNIIIIVIILVFSLILIATSLTWYLFYRNDKMSKDDEIAYSCCRNLKRSMKNPNSFKLYEVKVARLTENGETKEYCIINYAGTNSYNAIMQDEVVFLDGKFMGSTEDDLDKEDIDYEEKRNAMIDALSIKFFMDFFGGKTEDYEKETGIRIIVKNINCKKIIRKLNE